MKITNMGIKKLQVAQVAVWAVTACYVLLSEAEWLPTCFAQTSVQTEYWAQVYSVVSALAGSYVALRLFAFSCIKKKIARADEAKAMCAFRKCVGLRTTLVAIAMWSNAVIYYALSFHQTALYCFLISAVASCFCWPSEDTFKSLRTNKLEAK